jgi:hypothetical protein
MTGHYSFGGSMTLEYVAAQVAAIRQAAGDFEVAHAWEDELREDVLKAIASGAPDAAKLAREVLKTSEIKFARYTA